MAKQTKPVAVVTGAGSGIGRAVALGLASKGYVVMLLGRKLESLEATAAAGEDGTMEPLCCDVSNPDSVRSAFKTIIERFGRVDLLFNNAGSFPPARTIDEVSDDEWSSVVRVNLDGMFYCIREAFSIMSRQSPRGGRIINNGSVSSQAPRPRSIGYTATKHAVTGLTKATSLEGRAFDIACGQIDIGNASTGMIEHIEKGVLQADGSIRAEASMSLQHVVDAVLYMAALPLNANVPAMTVMATKMPLVGRG